jgi:transposase-like protein
MLDFADKFGAQPSQIYNWIRQILEQAERAFQVGLRHSANLENAKDRKIKQLER